MTPEQKADLIGLIRAYLVIPAWWCLYLFWGYIT
jgi:hypothetical protein